MDEHEICNGREGPAAAPISSSRSSIALLWELLLVFMRMGFTAFGGPAAHIALFEQEVVRRRQWLSHEQFLDLLGIVNLIPGPNSTQMVMHIGRIRGGVPGMFAAGLGFILPAALIVSVCAWLYLHIGALPQVDGILQGVKPVVVAVILQALWVLGRKGIASPIHVLLAGLSAVAVFLGAGELTVLLLTGTAMAYIVAARKNAREHFITLSIMTVCVVLLVGAALLLPGSDAGGARPFSMSALFLFFFKVGSILYGSGYVLIAFIESSLVTHWGWITRPQLLDAVAIGQVTPGPLFTTATFIGYLLAGFGGAVVATVGFLIPSFIFIAVSGPIIPRIRRSVIAGAFLDGIILAALALMGVVTVQLGVEILKEPVSILIGMLSAFLLLRCRVDAIWLILGGAVGGLLLSIT